MADAAGKDVFIEVVRLKAAIPCATYVRDGSSCRSPVEFPVNWAISTVGAIRFDTLKAAARKG